METNFSNLAARAAQSDTANRDNKHSVTLHWDASTSIVVGYNVYRSDKSGGPYKKLNARPIRGISYRDSSVRAGQRYYYVVKSVSSDKEESIASKEISAVIPAD
jgi:fibronectin type 3 domain-containing protein